MRTPLLPEPRWVSYAARPLAAIVAGFTLWLAFPDAGLWFLAPVGVAVLAAALWGAGMALGLVLGLLAGWAFFIPVLSWSGIYVGAVPWLALATLEAHYFAVMGGVIGLGTRWLGARGTTGATGATGATRAAYLLVPLAWMTQEWARGETPFGGFPWARLAFSQAGSPLAPWAVVAGAPGVTFVVALVGVLALAAVRALRQKSPIATVTWAVATLAVALSGLLIPLPTDGRVERIGFVQGNVPKAGLDFNSERRAVLDNHVRGTEELAGGAPGDLSLVVWPENASDIDPLRNPDAAQQIQRALAAVDVPILVGAVLAEPVGASSNVSLLYRPGGGAPERYTKIHVVPFAEYMPNRSFFRHFSAEVDLAGHFVGGSELGRFRIEGRAAGGTSAYWALPTICFEVAYDTLMRDTVTQPGTDPSVLIVQTNNATFGYTAESEQQFAISRIRAIEHGRSIVHVSTVGVSGVIAPDGTVRHKTGLFTADSRVAEVTVRSARTLADRLGGWPDRLAAGALLALLAVGWGQRRRARLDR